MPPHKNAGKTVAEILQEKLGSIRRARLTKGSPSWDDILELTWEEIDQRAKKREPGFKTLHKLLTNKDFDK